MSYSDDSLKKAAETKERLEQKIVELEVELTHLQDTLAVVNSILKTSSFQSAHSIGASKNEKDYADESISQTSNDSYNRSCNVCNVEIEMRKIGDRWGAYTHNSEERHKCENNE
tara:strand:+ start:1816 stop:2157 length:342 start_codon:yes stop_codon:yes gene_type:complete